MSQTKYYAVRQGKKPGIYRTWAEAQAQVSGVSGAQYKSFTSQADAQAYLQAATVKGSPSATAITVYTDGGSRNTGNVAGGHVKATDKAAWAYRIELPDRVVTDSQGEYGATNNRMEIMAFLRALERLAALGLTAAPIKMVLDSKYVLDAVTQGWLAGWKRRGWRRSAGELANAELWQAVDQQLAEFSHLHFDWTKGHATNQGNVFVDQLLNQTMDQMAASSSTAAAKAVGPQPTSDAPVADQATVQRSVAEIRRMLQDLDH